MITLQQSVNMNHTSKDLQHAYFVCPYCFDECYVLNKACSCGENIDKAAKITQHGLKGRLEYYLNGWYEFGN